MKDRLWFYFGWVLIFFPILESCERENSNPPQKLSPTSQSYTIVDETWTIDPLTTATNPLDTASDPTVPELPDSFPTNNPAKESLPAHRIFFNEPISSPADDQVYSLQVYPTQVYAWDYYLRGFTLEHENDHPWFLFDGKPETAWRWEASSQGNSPSFKMDLPPIPDGLAWEISLLNGWQNTENDFYGHLRASEIYLDIELMNGDLISIPVQLKNTPSKTTVRKTFSSPPVSMTVTIKEVHANPELLMGALSEITMTTASRFSQYQNLATMGQEILTRFVMQRMNPNLNPALPNKWEAKDFFRPYYAHKTREIPRSEVGNVRALMKRAQFIVDNRIEPLNQSAELMLRLDTLLTPEAEWKPQNPLVAHVDPRVFEPLTPYVKNFPMQLIELGNTPHARLSRWEVHHFAGESAPTQNFPWDISEKTLLVNTWMSAGLTPISSTDSLPTAESPVQEKLNAYAGLLNSLEIVPGKRYWGYLPGGGVQILAEYLGYEGSAFSEETVHYGFFDQERRLVATFEPHIDLRIFFLWGEDQVEKILVVENSEILRVYF